MRKFFRNILILSNLAAAAWLGVTYLSVYVSPATSWAFAFVAVSYPIALLLNLLFVVFWAVLRKWYLVISLAMAGIGYAYAGRLFQLRFQEPAEKGSGSPVKLLTYNVRLFNYYQWQKDTSTWQKIVQYIDDEQADIVCLQEFIAIPAGSHSLQAIKKKLDPLNYTHVHYTDRVPGKLNFGLATFSRYPIIRKEHIEFDNSLNGSIVSDIDTGNDTIRVFNCHLQSIRLRKDYNDLLDSLIFNYSEKQLDDLKDMSVRMRQAYIQRAGQADILARYIRSSPHPVIICGDFNDTPVSYAYNTLSRQLNDAFMEAGVGFGNTYRGNLPRVRIDYVLYSPAYKAGLYEAEKITWSDHFPVRTDLFPAQTADSTDPHFPPKE